MRTAIAGFRRGGSCPNRRSFLRLRFYLLNEEAKWDDSDPWSDRFFCKRVVGSVLLLLDIYRAADLLILSIDCKSRSIASVSFFSKDANIDSFH
mmetsp:Transcript_16383/g.42267  ORF Transcript_16383/g.42267 Transcript_16383/m.42267 type:complete len:94 (+) Transcript_16383:892-1173(+)